MSAVKPGWVWDEVSSLDYAHASIVLGVPVGWLKKAVPAGKVKHSRLGKHVVFTPDDIAENRRMSSQPVKGAPTVSIAPDDTYRAKLRNALLRAEAA
ncbi:MAG: hypothetical protein HOY79_20810 [Streptomyces sp.]|nr:hypothetical protein [Streptomyces sp.]